jgi:hypothetical protein
MAQPLRLFCHSSARARATRYPETYSAVLFEPGRNVRVELTLGFLESHNAAGSNPSIQVIALAATTVADPHAGGHRFFFDIATERLLVARQIDGGAS